MESKLVSKMTPEATDRFAKFFYANPCPMSVSRVRDGYFIDVNDSFARLTGYAREELLGRTSRDVNLWPTPQSRPQIIDQLLQHRTVRDMEITLRAREGQLYVVLLSAEIIDIE